MLRTVAAIRTAVPSSPQASPWAFTPTAATTRSGARPKPLGWERNVWKVRTLTTFPGRGSASGGGVATVGGAAAVAGRGSGWGGLRGAVGEIAQQECPIGDVDVAIVAGICGVEAGGSLRAEEQEAEYSQGVRDIYRPVSVGIAAVKGMILAAFTGDLVAVFVDSRAAG